MFVATSLSLDLLPCRCLHQIVPRPAIELPGTFTGGHFFFMRGITGSWCTSPACRSGPASALCLLVTSRCLLLSCVPATPCFLERSSFLINLAAWSNRLAHSEATHFVVFCSGHAMCLVVCLVHELDCLGWRSRSL